MQSYLKNTKNNTKMMNNYDSIPQQVYDGRSTKRYGFWSLIFVVLCSHFIAGHWIESCKTLITCRHGISWSRLGGVIKCLAKRHKIYQIPHSFTAISLIFSRLNYKNSAPPSVLQAISTEFNRSQYLDVSSDGDDSLTSDKQRRRKFDSASRLADRLIDQSIN